jgi:hypothetical protein
VVWVDDCITHYQPTPQNIQEEQRHNKLGFLNQYFGVLIAVDTELCIS